MRLKVKFIRNILDPCDSRGLCAYSRRGEFCMAKEVLEHKYKITIPQNAASHKYVRIEYKKQGRDDISDPLRNLREYRNCCDYDKKVKDLHKIVNESLIISEEIIKNL
jgi:hypothetical protein